MLKEEITVEMIEDMKHCIGFKENKVTGTKNRVMYAYRNHYYTHSTNKHWNQLIELGFARKNDSENERGLTYFRLNEKGLRFLADLCGYVKIIRIV